MLKEREYELEALREKVGSVTELLQQHEQVDIGSIKKLCFSTFEIGKLILPVLVEEKNKMLVVLVKFLCVMLVASVHFLCRAKITKHRSTYKNSTEQKNKLQWLNMKEIR